MKRNSEFFDGNATVVVCRIKTPLSTPSRSAMYPFPAAWYKVHMNRERHTVWLAQAEDDLRWGQSTLKAGHFAQACFIAQQVAEKALKALAFYRGADLVKSHSVIQISKDLGINGRILDIGKKLDLYYITTRYPDALPAGNLPYEQFSKDQAEEALKLAAEVIKFVKDNLPAQP